MIVGVSYLAGGCECYAFSQMIVGLSYHAGGCECCAFLEMIADMSYMLVNVSVGPF